MWLHDCESIGKNVIEHYLLFFPCEHCLHFPIVNHENKFFIKLFYIFQEFGGFLFIHLFYLFELNFFWIHVFFMLHL